MKGRYKEMPRNKIMDLNDLLFEQLENLITAESEDEVKLQVSKSKAVSSLATNIINTANISLEAKKLQLEYGTNLEGPIIPQLESKND